MKPARKTRSSDTGSLKHGDGNYGKVVASVKYSSLKDFARRFVDCNEFISHVQDWLLCKLESTEQQFKEPFQLDELRQLDYALEGVIFQQLLRMPYWQPGAQGNVEAEIHLAVEDFLHTIAQTLWETLWSSEDRMPFFVTGPRGSSKAKKSLEGVALVGKNGRGVNTVWEHVAEFVEIQPEIGGETGSAVSTIVGRTLFHGLHMLMSRLYTEKKPSVRRHTDTAYVLFVDSKCGGVMRLRGDITKLDTKTGLSYEMAAEWLEKYADVTVSSVEQVWNRFGNANWGDLGALQLSLATLYCIEQCRGSPRRSVAELAAEHGSRLHRRKIERRFLEIQENGIDHSYHQEHQSEIQEIEEIEAQRISRDVQPMRLDPGTVLWLEDGHRQSGFQVVSSLGDDKCSMYSATSLEDKTKALAVYVGAHPSQVEPSWEDMTTWYQVQRQTKVLNVMKQRGVSSRHLPQLVAAGRVLHPGSCSRQSPGGRCDHPWCGIPVLVTSPVGEPLDAVVAKSGWLPPEEALRCCHDILSALRSSGSAGIQHGDMNPRKVVRVKGGGGSSSSEFRYVLVDWGRAVLEDRDTPAVSPRYSSTYALQEGKLCPASDAESLVYVLFFLVGGNMPEFESMEAALQWRERAWALRTFQLLLGEISAVLKAYADYIDSLIGTPYPADYDIWLRRLSRAIQSHNSSSASLGKRIQYIEGGPSARSFDYSAAEASGTA